MEKNKSVILYGAGFRGGRIFLALAEENVHVEAFCDRDAASIPLYFGCEVLTKEETLEKYSDLPFIVCIDDDQAKERVVNELRESGVDIYNSFEAFFQGENDVEIQTVQCGSKATFQIIPELLKNRDNLVGYSFGIGFDFSFEIELAEKYKMNVYAYDPSPEVIETMKQQNLPDNLLYSPYGLSDEDDEKVFYLPSSGQDYSEYFTPWTSNENISMQVYRLSTLMKKNGHTCLDLLKMDIEGSEFMALPDILKSGVKFDQLCIETHTRIFSNSVEKMRGIKCLLNEYGYLMVSNGRQEQTYIRKELIK